MTKKKRIHGAGGGGGGGGGGNQVVNVNQEVIVQNPVYTPTYTPDDPGLKSTSFAQLQMLVCEGEVYGPVRQDPTQPATIEDLERAVYLDNTPVRQGATVSPQPEDLVFSWGRPHVGVVPPGEGQSGVPGFVRVSNVTSVDSLVRKDFPIAQTISAPDTTGNYLARVLLTFAGLQRNTDKGDVLGSSVEIRITYQDANTIEREAYKGSVSGKFSGQFQKEYEFELEGPSPWRVQVERLTGDPGTSERNEFNFSSLILSLDQKLSYPQSSMLSIGLRADQYNQLPEVSVEMRGCLVEVPSNYDPETRAYTGDWDGTFKRAYSNNPAWVLRDLIVNDRYGLGSYIDTDLVDRWVLYEIAQYCDAEVPANEAGDMEPRFTCNLILQTSEEAWNVLQQLSSIFRGMLYYASGTIVATQDRDRMAVYTFNESNTIEQFDDSGKVSQGNFVYAGPAKRARHTVVLASWDDPKDGYQPRVEYVADEEAIGTLGYRAMDLRLMGVTSRGQALRAANWALLSESLLDDTVSFSTNEVGSAVRPGDNIAILDPGKSGRRYGGRIKAVSGDTITIDDIPPIPPTGWTGSTFSYMIAGPTGEPALYTRHIVKMMGDQVTLSVDTAAPAPVATFPWMIEAPNRSAQRFRVLTVEEQEGGIYAITALRYREDIYDAVDFDTPLNDNEDYLYQVINPDAPTITTAQVIWDNGQAKIDVAWQPASSNAVLNGFDLSVRSYRLQYEAGELQPDGTIRWDGVWREVEQQFDNREQIPIAQFVATDRFRVRVAAVGRLGAESEWAQADVDDITVWFPMPDLGGTHEPGDLPNAKLDHLNQSNGSHLYTWRVDVSLPPYVNGIELQAAPTRPLNATEAEGLRDPDHGDYYVIGQFPIQDYYSFPFHSAQSWNLRFRLTTAIPGLEGTTYATDRVDREEIVPPAVVNFRVVHERGAQSRVGADRFSWEMPDPPPFAVKWPLRKVTDIATFNIRYRAGTTPDWDRSFALFSDGIPGDQTWFETHLFDYGEWVIMIKPQDVTGWESDDFASVVMGVGEPLPTNAVHRIDFRDQDFPGVLDNFTKRASTGSLMYPAPLTDAIYQLPVTDAMYEGLSGFYLEQTDATDESNYTVTFRNDYDDCQLVIYTQATSTYRWFLRELPGSMDLMYPPPLTDPFYGGEATGKLVTDMVDDVATEKGDHFLVVYSSDIHGLMYATGGYTGAQGWHPYAPNEALETGTYEARLEMISLDGTTPGKVTDVDFVLDYPDVNWQAEDFAVPAAGARLTFPPKTFRVLKAVQMTVQDDSYAPGNATNAILTFKDDAFIDIKTLDPSGNPVAGVVDVFAVGY